ncbi:MAG: TOBE domain-containing protein [Candidatus Helarchaeota archaeon]
MKISARNKIQSVIKKITIKGLISELELETLEPSIITVVITKDAVSDLNLKENDYISVFIKPTEVIIKEIDE